MQDRGTMCLKAGCFNQWRELTPLMQVCGGCEVIAVWDGEGAGRRGLVSVIAFLGCFNQRRELAPLMQVRMGVEPLFEEGPRRGGG